MFKKRKLVLALTLGCLFSISVGETIAEMVNADSDTEILNDPTQFLGYGYDVSGNKQLYNHGAFFTAMPILNLKDSSIKEAMETKGLNPEATYTNNVSRSAIEIAKEYSKEWNGGLSFNVSIAAVQIDGLFNLTKNSSWGSKQSVSEEYSYYSIVSKKMSAGLNMDPSELRNHLDSRFEAKLCGITTVEEAADLYATYGTHMPTGYTLGGIMTLTNYFAANTSSYNMSNREAFSAQIGAAISASANANINFSFDEKYGQTNNNSEAVNNYRCSTFGGMAFEGATIDSVFKYKDQVYDSHYAYYEWLKSINNGQGLAVIGIPNGYKMLPLWDLLPEDGLYSKTRELMVQAYVQKCGNTYKEFKSSYPTAENGTIVNEQIDTSFTVQVKGCQYFVNQKDGVSKYQYSYIPYTSGERINVKPNSLVAMDYDELSVGTKPCVWRLKEADAGNYATIEDSRNGVLKIGDQKSGSFTLLCVNAYDDSVVESIKFTINNSGFSGGDGTESNPYIVSNANDFKNIASKASAKCYFKLVDDIDLSDDEYLAPIGGSIGSSFNGVFDGNFHKVYFPLEASPKNTGISGLFGYNEGTIKNLSLVGGGSSKSKSQSYLKTFTDVEAEEYLDAARLTTKDKNTEGSNGDLASEGNCGVLKVAGTTTMKLDDSNYLGILVGMNKKGGSIENCEVNDITLISDDGQKGDYKSIGSDKYASGGIICGENEGTISSCTAKNSRALIRANIFINAKVGGICGVNGATESSASISDCMVDGISTFAYCGQYNNTERLSKAGGLVGEMAGGHLQYSVVKNVNGSDEYTSYQKSIISNASYYNTFGGKIYAYSGGLAGYVSENSGISVNGCVVINSPSIFTLAKLNHPANKKFHLGAAFGQCEASNEQITNCFVQTSGNASTVGEGNVSNVRSKNTAYSYSELTSDLQEHFDSESSEPAIKRLGVDLSTFTVDVSEAKKRFFVGDDFKIGNIDVTVRDNTKDANLIEITEYNVDYSSFDSSFPHNNIPIAISYMGASSSYYVDVVTPGDSYIYVKTEPKKTVYLEGESFDPTGMEVYMVKENGTETLLPLSSLTLSSSPAVVGSNAVMISTTGSDGTAFDINYYYRGKAKEVTAVTILKEPTTKDYAVGVTNLSFQGISLKVDYKEGESDTFGENDIPLFEVVAPKIGLGENVITVCYDAYLYDTFTVTGTATVDPSLVKQFSAAVNAIGQTENLQDMFAAIKAAEKALEPLGDYTTAEIETAKAKLNEYKAAYDAKVNTINADFDSSIAIVSPVKAIAAISVQSMAFAFCLLILIKGVAL